MRSKSMSNTVRTIEAPLSPAGGATVTGLDLAQPLTPDVRDRIQEAFRDRHIVIFPGQALSREQQYAFAVNFGEIEAHGGSNPQMKRHAVAHVISNVDSTGNPVDRS